MKGSNSWSYAPYKPFLFDCGDIYICRVVPDEKSVSFWWLPAENADSYSVYFRREGDGDFILFAQTSDCSCVIDGLDCDVDYEFYCRSGDMRSRTRLAHTGAAVGTVVNYLHPRDEAYSFSGRYLCSPSMVRCPDGALLASMDLFAGSAPQNLTLIFRSDDDGVSWNYVSELMPCFWGKLFIHRGALYMLSCSTEYGDLLIGRSDDWGKTFAAPTVLLRGSCRPNMPGVHKNPELVVSYGGRIWNTCEWGSWGAGYHAPMVFSCDENADLLSPESWTFTYPVRYNPSWSGVAEGPSTGNIEGCLVVAPDGKLYNIMRYDMTRCKPNYGLILSYRVNTEQPNMPLEYDHAIKFPGNHSKFIIQYDEQSGYYLSIMSRILSPECSGSRNLLSFMKSNDLKNWTLVTDLLDYRDCDPKFTGFQYVDFMFDGEDIIWLCRTAINHPHSFHDSNYTTFHRIKDFRTIL